MTSHPADRGQLTKSESNVFEIAKKLARLAAQRDHDCEQTRQAGAEVSAKKQ